MSLSYTKGKIIQAVTENLFIDMLAIKIEYLLGIDEEQQGFYKNYSITDVMKIVW